MRNRNTAILATAFVAITAGALALGVTQGDKIKTFFASKEVYKNEQTQNATTTNGASAQTLSDATQASQTLTNNEATSIATASNTETTPATVATETTTASNETATPAATEAATETAAGGATTTPPSGGMTQIDLPAGSATANKDDANKSSSLGTQPLTPEQVAAANATPAPEAGSADSLPTDSKGTYNVDVKKALENRSVGSASAKLVVDDFSSLTCPHCARFHNDIYPKIKANYIDTGKVRWVFHSFPLNEPALKADMVARCAPGGDDQYFKLTEFMFKNQERWAFTDQPIPNLNMLLKIAGVTDDIFLSCINNKELEAGLVKSAQEATAKYKIEATPSFVFNDGLKTFSGVGSYEGFADDLNHALESLAGPRKEKSLTDAAKETAAPAEKK